MTDAPSIGEPAPRLTVRLRPDADGVARAGAILRRGGLVALPTETVYGLGADARDPAAVATLYAAKERPRFNPLIAHLPDAASAGREGVLEGAARRLAEAFWPGALTLVVPVAPGGTVCDLARAGLGSVALRVPSHPLAQAILREAGTPVVAPSANRSGRVSPTSAEHVLADLDGRIDAVLDGGATAIGVESTIVACLDGTIRLLRPGGIPRDRIEAALGRALDAPVVSDEGAPLAPGLLASHYAPRAAVRLDATAIRPGEAALLFGGRLPGTGKVALDLSPTRDLTEAATNLFGHLRRLDATGTATIAVAPIPTDGLGEAIADRLARAASGR